MTDWERSEVERRIISHYDDFVGKVAAGRGMEYDEVERIARGRVWTGREGKNNGLVDELGGLETAIRIAKRSAGLDPDEIVDLVQFPTPPLFDLSHLLPKVSLFRMETGDRNVGRYLRFLAEHNGEALPMLPMDHLYPLMNEKIIRM